MPVFSRLFVLLALAPMGAIGCSDGDGEAAATGEIPVAFSGYCDGKLLVRKTVWKPIDPAGWMTGLGMKAPAGQLILIGGYNSDEGYMFAADGTPRQIDVPFGEELKEGIDYTSDCAANPNARKVTVLLANARFYANNQLSGTACEMAAGTEMTSFGIRSDGKVATISADELNEQCGWDEAYTDSIVAETLVTR